MNVLALLTCHNRRDVTIGCLTSLFEQDLGESRFEVRAVLVDDGSTDGTSEAIRNRFPKVQIVKGSGSLYWAGGMRLAWEKARHERSEFVLLLNDDTMLLEGALQEMLTCAEISDGAVVGCIRDPHSKSTSYGGYPSVSWYGQPHFLIDPEPDTPKRCGFANANAFLVPRSVIDRLGFLSDRYTHRLADFDFSLRITKAGIPLVVTRKHVGECEDDHGQAWLSSDKTLKQRIAYLYNPKYLAYHEYLYFIRTHYQTYYPMAFIKLWMKTLLPQLWSLRKS